LLSEHDGDWEAYQEYLYHLYAEMFARELLFRGRRVNRRRWPEYKGKCKTFWHIIQEDTTPAAQRRAGIRSEENRTVDLRRCERIMWISPIIEAADTPNVRTWSNNRRGESHWVIALRDFSYLVALADRGEYLLLASAYPVYANRRKLHQSEYEAWGEAQES
jgi:hypothetical protein